MHCNIAAVGSINELLLSKGNMMQQTKNWKLFSWNIKIIQKIFSPFIKVLKKRDCSYLKFIPLIVCYMDVCMWYIHIYACSPVMSFVLFLFLLIKLDNNNCFRLLKDSMHGSLERRKKNMKMQFLNLLKSLKYLQTPEHLNIKH